MAFADDIKTALRIDGTDSDTEVNDLVEAAKLDLKIAGVKVGEGEITDHLIKRAIILYCKANYGYEDVQMADRIERSYISLKQHLSLSTEYAEVVAP